MSVVAERVAEIISGHGQSLNVISGFRTIEEVHHITRVFPRARIILIEADIKSRFERHIRRARDRDVKTYRDFLRQDEEQAHFGVLRVASEIADSTLRNDTSIENFQRRIDDFIAGLSSPSRDRPQQQTQSSELSRSLKALNQIGHAATCDEISDATTKFGPPVRKYNTNRALKEVPELATRIKNGRDLLRYRITLRGRLLLSLLDARNRAS